MLIIRNAITKIGNTVYLVEANIISACTEILCTSCYTNEVCQGLKVGPNLLWLIMFTAFSRNKRRTNHMNYQNHWHSSAVELMFKEKQHNIRSHNIQYLHVVLPTPPLPPTNIHFNESWSIMFRRDGSNVNVSSVLLAILLQF